MANYSDNLFGEAQLAFLQDFTRVLHGVRRGSLKGFLKVRYKGSVVASLLQLTYNGPQNPILIIWAPILDGQIREGCADAAFGLQVSICAWLSVSR